MSFYECYFILMNVISFHWGMIWGMSYGVNDSLVGLSYVSNAYKYINYY